MSALSLALAAAFVLSLSSSVSAHALMSLPEQRGVLPGSKFAPFIPGIPGAPKDTKPHFPAGNKDNRPGSGKLSQERATGFVWRMFTPESSTYRWPAGVCGDDKNGRQDHMRGGEYYFDGHIVGEYPQGGVLESKLSMVAHHNGFIELRICDVAKCGGEISEACFREGHCKLLERTLEPSCESRVDKMCGPRDPDYPGRWYVPCTTGAEIDQYGGEKMRFKLPADLTCEHCVLHWYYGTANGCNPPGVKEYFRGPRGPQWGTCRGAAGAIGGYTSVQKDCGSEKYAEEYFQCADIRIGSTSSRSGDMPDYDSESEMPDSDSESEPDAEVEKPTPPTEPVSVPVEEDDDEPDKEEMMEATGSYDGPVKSVVFWANGSGGRKIAYGETADISVGMLNDITFEAETDGDAAPVAFTVDGKRARTEWKEPYFMFGDVGDRPNSWKEPIYDRTFELLVEAKDTTFKCWVHLTT